MSLTPNIKKSILVGFITKVISENKYIYLYSQITLCVLLEKRQEGQQTHQK